MLSPDRSGPAPPRRHRAARPVASPGRAAHPSPRCHRKRLQL